MNLPSRSFSPLRTILPSLTAMTGEPLRAKMLIPRRSWWDSTTSAAFSPAFVFSLGVLTWPA